MKQKKRITIKIFMLLVSMIIMGNLFAQTVPLVYDVENTGASCSVTYGNTSTSLTTLPDPFTMNDGTKVSTFDGWKCRRNEIKKDLEQYEIGPKPDKPQNITATYSGGTLTVNVTVNGQTLTLTSKLNVPSGAGPHPVVIGMNSATGGITASLFSGCITMPFNHDQIVYYNMNSQQRQTDPYYKVYPDLWGKIGNYSAWSWGISRLIDGLELVKDQINVDLKRIAVTGCSYAGKMALFGGAFDERVALTIVQESGGGGINSWRLSQAFTTRTGTNVEKIDNTNYSWFKSSMKNLNPNTLPHDHHELIAMIAPRAVLILGNPYQEWLGDESGYKTTMAALEVWKAMKVEDRFGFDFASGHEHCQLASSQSTASKAFIDKFMKNLTANTNIKSAPVNPKFNLDYAAAIKWTTPTFVSDETTPKVAITAPAASASIEAGAAVAIAATATDTDGTITKVEFSVNGTLMSTDETSPYTATWTPTTKGAYTITAKATDNTNKTGTATVTVNVTVPQSPYGGTPHAIPGKIEFEHFDEGGANSAYSDSSPGSETDVAFRADEDVDIENCTDVGTGYNIGWTAAGEWLEYTVNVGAAGKYKLDLRVACNGTGRTLTLKMGETTIANNVTIPSTTGWQVWQTVSVPEVTLAAGKQVLRVTIGATDYVNLNYMTFTSLEVKDDCPNDPNKTAPGTCGCGVPDVDTDKDGTMDCLDACPADANKTEPGLCGCGVEEGTCSTISIPLKAGWNLVGYPLDKSVSIEIAFSSVFDKLEIVKDLNGFYTKSGNSFLNSLQTVKWANGYLVKVSAPCELKWTDK